MSRKGVKLRATWMQEDMDKALEAVRLKNVPVRTASRDYGVPKTTLIDRLKKRINDKCDLGTPTKLSAEHEELLCKYIEYMALRAMPLTVNQIIMYAWCIDRTAGKKVFGNSGPCYGWWISFRNRHPESIKLRKPDSLDRGRAIYSTVDNLRSYFQLLKEVLADQNLTQRPQDIYNCDESIVDLNKSNRKVVIPRRMKAAHSRQIAGSEHISIHCCVSASGVALPPMLIFKGSFPGGNYADGGPDGCLYGKQDSGFMDSVLFLKWFQNLFLPHARPTPERSVLLLLNGHASHCSPDLIECAKSNNVVLLALAPHTTHICQPLDVAVYKSFKSHLDKHLKIGQSVRGDLWIPRNKVPRMIKNPFESSMTMANIKSGFRKCGIHPYDPNAIDKKMLMRNKLIPNETVDLAIPPEGHGVSVATQTDSNMNPEPEIHLSNEIRAPVTSQSMNAQHDHENIQNDIQTLQIDQEPIITNNDIGCQTVLVPEVAHSVPEIVVATSSDNLRTPPNALIQPSTSGLGIKRSSSNNPLVNANIISPELASVFLVPDEEIPLGRKRPLRIKSKARVMTSEEVIQDLKEQKEVLANKKVRNNSKGNGKIKSLKAKKCLNPKDDDDDDGGNGMEDNDCYICGRYWDCENTRLQKHWVGCETCTHWCCPRCLETGFDYKNDYFCMDCV